MNRKKWLPWVIVIGILLLLYLWWSNRPAREVKDNWAGPPYLTYNQPGAGSVTLNVAGVNTPKAPTAELTPPQSSKSCGCNPAVSAAMAQGYDMAGAISASIGESLNQYANSLNDYLASQIGA